MARGYQKGFRVAEVRIGAGPVAGLVSKSVGDKIAEQRTLLGSKYDAFAKRREGWPSALTRELELKRALALNPNAKFVNEKDDPEFELNEANMSKVIMDADVEVGVLYDKYNRLISFTKGSKERVLADALRSQFEGGTFIHNHPLGGPLSAGDISAHGSLKSASTKALSPEGVYVIEGPLGGKYEGLKEEIWAVQAAAVSHAAAYAYSLFKGQLTEEQRVAFKKTSDLNDLPKVLPKEVANKVNAILSKFAWERTKAAVAKFGKDGEPKLTFTPSKRFKEVSSYDNYDAVPTVPEIWRDESDDPFIEI